MGQVFKIVEWGPGFRQRHDSLMVGRLGVKVEDPTKVLFWQGSKKIVIGRIPGPGGTLWVVSDHMNHDYKLCDRLMAHLVEHQGDEIDAYFESCKIVEDCYPATNKIDDWVMAGLYRWTYDANERVSSPFGPRSLRATLVKETR